MESKESETVTGKNASFSKTQTYITKTIHSKNNDSNTIKGGIKLPKLYSNTFYNSSQASNQIINIGNNIVTPFYDKVNLKQELSEYKTEINKKKIELQELKIKFNKLSEDNKINKMLLAKILNIDLEREFTKEELIKKLECCELGENEQKILEETHQIMSLKLDLEEKKMKINLQQEEEEILTKNTKSKIMNELESEFLIKCEKNKKLLKSIKKLEDIIKNKEKEIKSVEEEYKVQEDFFTGKNKEYESSKNAVQKKDNDVNKLRSEVNELNNKQKKLKDTLNKSRKELDINKSIEKKKEEINKIKKYENKRDKINKEVEEKKEKNKNLEKQKKDLEKKFDELKKSKVNYQVKCWNIIPKKEN